MSHSITIKVSLQIASLQDRHRILGRTASPFAMNARPIISRLFASTCPTCRYSVRRSIASSRTTSALRYSTSTNHRTASALEHRPSSVATLNLTHRAYRPILSHLGRTYATASKGTGSSTSIKVIPPTPDSLKTSEEFEDAEFIPEEQANITVTDDAVKVSWPP